MGQGVKTREFGEWLTKELKPTNLKVFFDHGDKAEYPSNVAAIKGFVSTKEFTEVKNVNRLTDVDIMIVNSNNEIILLLEIEERYSSPKKILGDLFAITLCNKFAVKMNGEQQYFLPTKETSIIISGVLPKEGSRRKKVTEIIEPRIAKLSHIINTFSGQNISLIFIPGIDSLLAILKKEIRKIKQI